MNNDEKELLMMAAKAAGAVHNGYRYGAHGREPLYAMPIETEDGTEFQAWNPMEDDGDALRLAVKLGISILPYPVYAEQKHSVMAKKRLMPDTMRIANPTETIEPYGDDPCAATRRAIVHAAAAIWMAMP